MLDIKLIRSDLDLVKKSVNRRGKDYSEFFDKIVDIDKQRRYISSKCDNLKCEQNIKKSLRGKTSGVLISCSCNVIVSGKTYAVTLKVPTGLSFMVVPYIVRHGDLL